MRSEIEKFVAKEVKVRGVVSAKSSFGYCIERISVNDKIGIDHSWIQQRDNPQVKDWVVGQHVAGRAIVGRYKKPSGVDYNFKAFRVED